MDGAKQLQAQGNALYGDGRYAEARDCYSQALALLSMSLEGSETAAVASQLLANRAQTAIQERDFGAALADARLALKRSPRNEKAAVRQLIALENLERFEAALVIVNRVLDGEPDANDPEWRWTRESAPTLFQYCVAARRRLRKMVAKDKEAAAKELNQLGKLVHENQQLRINFGSLVPSQVPVGNFFDLSVNIGNEFGLFRRDAFKDGETVALKCELYTPFHDQQSPYRLVVRLDLEDSVDALSAGDDKGPITLNDHGKATFRVAVIPQGVDTTKVDVMTTVALQVSVDDSCAEKWNLFPVVSLPIQLVAKDAGMVVAGDSGALGVHCCRPIRMHGLPRDILLAESPGSLGIGGKLWDSCLILTRYLARRREIIVGKKVVELGSGLGLVGIYCSLLGAHVTLTDMGEVVPLIDYNIELNYATTLPTSSPAHRPRAVEHMWGSTDGDLLATSHDVVVLSDVVYDPEGYEPLVASLCALAKSPNTVILMAHRSRNPKEHQFFELLGQHFAYELVDWRQDEQLVGTGEAAHHDGLALQDVKIFSIRRHVDRD